MQPIVLKGIITEDGRLELELPPDLPPGPVEVEIRGQDVRGITGQEILDSEFLGMWADRKDITDSVEFARELRRRAQQRNHPRVE